MEFRFDPSARRSLVRTFVAEGQAESAFAPDDRFQFGIEEEYFLTDAQTAGAGGNTGRAVPARQFRRCRAHRREFLQAQIEVATEPHIRAGEAGANSSGCVRMRPAPRRNTVWRCWPRHHPAA